MPALQLKASLRRSIGLAGLAGFLLFAGDAWAADGAPLFPHRALYVVQLKGAAAGIVQANGVASTTLERTCDGWIVESRMATELTSDEGKIVRLEARLSGWESTDGTAYRFAASSDFADTKESFKGNAAAAGPSAPAKVDYSVPAPASLPLPPGTLFPVAHLRFLIDKARTGERMATAIVFDGTEAVGARLATAFVRPAAPLDAETVAKLGGHATEAAWNMRVAYFPADGSALTPDFEVETVQLQSGIVASIVADYPDFAMLLRLQSLEPLAAPRC